MIPLTISSQHRLMKITTSKLYPSESENAIEIKYQPSPGKKTFCERLYREKMLLVMAEPVSSKSTQLPQYAAECFPDNLIVCTQPQVSLTRILARRVAHEYDGTSEGHSVDYQIGNSNQHRDCYIRGTNIMFMTDTALIDEFQLDTRLSQIRVLIIDNVQERSLGTDMVMGIAKLVLAQRKTDFSLVIIASTDIDPIPFLKFFDCSSNEPLNIASRCHPVTVDYIPAPAFCPQYKLIESHVVPTLQSLYERHAGHTLVFLSSPRDIESAIALFRSNIPSGCIALPLHESLEFEEQNKVFELDSKKSNQRIVIFCTAMAEISTMVTNIQLVIDTGLKRQINFDSQHQFNVLETVHISRSSANKRRDKAGCARRGHCVRLYNDHELTEKHMTPEILRSSLDLAILQLKNSGLDLQNFPFITKPNPASVRSSLEFLTSLLCLDKHGSITTRGKLFTTLAVDPRFSSLMVNIYIEEKGSQELLDLMATIVALLSTPASIVSVANSVNQSHDTLLHSPNAKILHSNSDLLYLYTLINDWRKTGIIDRMNDTCMTCHRRITHPCDACKACQHRYSLTNGLSQQSLELVQQSVDYFIKTITDPHWELQLCHKTTHHLKNDVDIIGAHLRRLFPAQIGHLLVSHLPDEGVRLINSDIRASIANRSVYVERTQTVKDQYFVAMFITRLLSGNYVVDRLHRISSDHLPKSSVQQLFVRENIGWSFNNQIRSEFNRIRSEPWTKWVVFEYDRLLARLTVWGLTTDRKRLESFLKPILEHTHTRTIECGPIRAIFEDGLVCSAIESMETMLRLNLQRVPCKTYEKLQEWLRNKLDIHGRDIKENNFQACVSSASDDDDDDDDDNDDTYEAPPFYIILKSSEVFQRATARLSAHHICAQEELSSSTTGTHMMEKDAWGRQLVLTIPPGSRIMMAEEILNCLVPYALDCRQFGRRSIRDRPGLELTNLPRNITESSIRTMLQPIQPLKISLRQTHKENIGSTSAYLFFSTDQQRQQAILSLQTGLCQKAINITVRSRTSHQLVQKQIVPTLRELHRNDANPLRFLITAKNRESALKLYKEIIVKIDSSWQIEGSATVTVTYPHLYPNFDTLVQQIAHQFDTEVQQQRVDRKTQKRGSIIRCYFHHGTPQQTALAATMLAQATSPIIIKMTNDRQKQLFDELFTNGIIQEWSNKLKLEVRKIEKSEIWVEIRGPQVQQGQLMRQIADYSDAFDERFRILELNSAVAKLFGRKRVADNQLQALDDRWSQQGCCITYVSKTKSIIIYVQPHTRLKLMESCEVEIKQVLSQLSSDNKIVRDKQKCVFCGTHSYATNTLRLCGHVYCRCASSNLGQRFPLKCKEPKCQMNINLDDLLEIFADRDEFMRVCKKSIEQYLKKNAATHEEQFCPNPACQALVRRNRGYQTCLICGKNVCPSCSLIDDELHEGRTCAERERARSLGDFLPNVFKAAEQFARDNWTTQTPPIIRIDCNQALINQCPSLQRFYKGVDNLGQSLPPDMATGFFAFHGTASTSINPICTNGFDPSRRAGQACGVGEYFGVTAAVSHGYCRPSNPQGPYAMIIAYLLQCPQLSTRPGFCHVMNNPRDWSYAFNLPVLVVSYGTQGTCSCPLTN